MRVNFSDTQITYVMARATSRCHRSIAQSVGRRKKIIDHACLEKIPMHSHKEGEIEYTLLSTRGSVVGWRKNMRGRTRFYRIHLIAYDVVANCYWCFPRRIPSPIPITLIPILSQKRKRLPRKIRLLRVWYVPGTTIVVSETTPPVSWIQTYSIECTYLFLAN